MTPMNSPIPSIIDFTKMSPSMKADYMEEFLESHTHRVGDYVFVPAFKMGGGISLDRLECWPNIEIRVDFNIYEQYELDVRVVYISVDAKDKRPFIYWGSVEAYGVDNRKTFLIDLINPIDPNRKSVKTVYIDNNKCNLGLDNIDVQIDQEQIDILPVPPSSGVHELKHSEVSKKLSDTITKQVLVVGETKPPVIPPSLDPKIDIPSIYIQPKSVMDDVKDPIKYIEDLIKEKIPITLEHLYADPTFKFKWVHKNKGKDKHEFPWKTSVHGHIVGKYVDRIEAAKAANDYILDKGLPYALNNIPGYFEDRYRKKLLRDNLSKFTTSELSWEVCRRVTKHKF
jgi:hypothetical protein